MTYLRVGGLSRVGLIEALRTARVLLNASAETLLEDAVFDHAQLEEVQIIEHTVGELSLANGGSLSQVFAAARKRGLDMCPPTTGPYMRLSRLSQQSAPDAIMSNGHAPSGSVTIASSPLREDDQYPKGFYLRVVNGVPWLRGYCCTDQHTWAAQDRFAFRLARQAG